MPKKEMTKEQLNYVKLWEKISVHISAYVKGLKLDSENLKQWQEYGAAMKKYPKELREFYLQDSTEEDDDDGSNPPSPPPPPPGPR